MPSSSGLRNWKKNLLVNVVFSHSLYFDARYMAYFRTFGSESLSFDEERELFLSQLL